MNNLNQALILCGGKGKRLKPITDDIPKPLVKINNESLLSHQLKYLNEQGIDNFVVATGYKSELIENYLNEKFYDFNIEIYNSGEVGIMNRIYDCLPSLNNNFLLCYGDTLANVNIKQLFKFHQKHNGDITVSSYQLRSQFGILKSNKKNLVLKFLEKPKLDAWINIGYFVMDKKLISNENSFQEFISKLATEEKLYNYKHRGLHITVNTFKELEEANLNIVKFRNDNNGK